MQSKIKAKEQKHPSNLNRCSFKCLQCCLLSSYMFTRGCSVAHLCIDMCVGVCFRQSEKVYCSNCFHWPHQQKPSSSWAKCQQDITAHQVSHRARQWRLLWSIHDWGLEVTFSVSRAMLLLCPKWNLEAMGLPPLRLYLCFHLMFSTMSHLHRSHQTWPPGV